MSLQNISRRIVGSVLIYVPPSNIFPTILQRCFKDFTKIVRLVFAALIRNWLTNMAYIHGQTALRTAQDL